MLFRTYGLAILTLHERYSRILIAVRPPGKAASPIASAMAAILAPLPTVWRQTISFDNGAEFARHHELHALGIETFFCDNYSPCPKNSLLKRCRRKTILRANASAIRLRPRLSGTKRCSSNVNPPRSKPWNFSQRIS